MFQKTQKTTSWVNFISGDHIVFLAIQENCKKIVDLILEKTLRSQKKVFELFSKEFLWNIFDPPGLHALWSFLDTWKARIKNIH